MILIEILEKDVIEFNQLYFDKHPRAKNKPIKAPQHPSINEYCIMHNQKANKLKQHWKDFIVWKLESLNLCNKNIKKCRITYKTFFKYAHRHDVDNISPKYIFDGFVEANFLEDDDLDHVISLTIEGALDKENPRMEFYVDVLE